jgi:hypothetical protein
MRFPRVALAATALLAVTSVSATAAPSHGIRQTFKLTIYGPADPSSGFEIYFNYRDGRGNRPARVILPVCGRIVAPIPSCQGRGKSYTVKVTGLYAPVRETIKFERVDPRKHGLPRATPFRTITLQQRHSMIVATSYRFS